jgi:general nucleoside transport system ATP-binding protein
MPDALSLSHVHKSFDGFVALAEAHFTARWGEVHALLGENGAGKSSLMNIAAGLYAPESGQLMVDDNPVTLSGPRDAARYQIGMVHQHFKLVSPFTVAENILLGQVPDDEDVRSYRQRLANVRNAILSKSRELQFDIDPDQPVAQLSVAAQQRVEILKVLLAGARILILDEPTAVLTDQEAARLLQTIQALARQGAAVVLVTHKMADVLRYADRVTVMRSGRTVATVNPADVNEAELVRLAVGETLPAPVVERSHPGSARLSLRGLHSSSHDGQPALDGIDLTVHAGEIYGLAGVGGNGQTELAQAIMGMLSLQSGAMELEGFGDLRAASTMQRREMGIAAIPADRYGLALVGGLSVAENFGIGQVHSGRYGRSWWLNHRRMAKDAEAAVQTFDIKGVRSIRQKAALLSGGNAQKLVIAREFSREPRLVLVHSPSRGLDVRATAQVHERLRAARDAGAAVLLISEDLDEVLALSDRIGVIVRGKIVAEFGLPADRQAIGQAMVAHG